MKISDIQCDACRADASRVSSNEARDFMAELPAWSIDSDAGHG